MIRKNNLFPNWEGWQVGYFLGTYAASERKRLIKYIINQEIHHGEDQAHKAETYQEELIRLLEEHSIEWNEKYLQ